MEVGRRKAPCEWQFSILQETINGYGKCSWNPCGQKWYFVLLLVHSQFLTLLKRPDVGIPINHEIVKNKQFHETWMVCPSFQRKLRLLNITLFSVTKVIICRSFIHYKTSLVFFQSLYTMESLPLWAVHSLVLQIAVMFQTYFLYLGCNSKQHRLSLPFWVYILTLVIR